MENLNPIESDIITVGLLEDDPTYTETFRFIVGTCEKLNMGPWFRTATELLHSGNQYKFDVLLVDIEMGRVSGIDCLQEIRILGWKFPVVMLTLHDADDLVLKSFIAGANGYLLKDAHPDRLVEAVEEAMRGGAPMSPSIARKVTQLLGTIGSQIGSSASKKPDRIEDILSSREFEVLTLLSEGSKYAEIAKKLYISLPTVKTHIRHIYEKLQVRNRSEAIIQFLQQ